MRQYTVRLKFIEITIYYYGSGSFARQLFARQLFARQIMYHKYRNQLMSICICCILSITYLR